MTQSIPAHLPVEALHADTAIEGTSQTVGDFWAWAYTDLLDSMTRGTFAEFLVRTALSIDGSVRDNGSAWDLDYGGVGIQVKSSSAVQRWRRLSTPRISFGVKLSRPYDSVADGYGELTRSGDCWVFCVLRPRDRDLGRARTDLLNTANWWFWAVPTRWLPESRKSITLDQLRPPFATMVDFAQLRSAVDDAIRDNIAGSPVPALLPMTANEWHDEEGLHLVPADRLERIVDLIETVVVALRPTHPGWRPHYQPQSAGIRTARGQIRLQVRADLFERDGSDVLLGLRVPTGMSAPTSWRGESDGDGRDDWWPASSADMPSAETVADALRSLYPRG